MSQPILGGLIQALSMSKHISRNREATMKAPQKKDHDNFFFILEKKRPFFFSQIWQYHQKKVIALNLYIVINVLVYERWLVQTFGTRPASRTLLPLHTLTFFAILPGKLLYSRLLCL